jgi:hypothetical protein
MPLLTTTTLSHRHVKVKKFDFIESESEICVEKRKKAEGGEKKIKVHV